MLLLHTEIPKGSRKQNFKAIGEKLSSCGKLLDTDMCQHLTPNRWKSYRFQALQSQAWRNHIKTLAVVQSDQNALLAVKSVFKRRQGSVNTSTGIPPVRLQRQDLLQPAQDIGLASDTWRNNSPQHRLYTLGACLTHAQHHPWRKCLWEYGPVDHVPKLQAKLEEAADCNSCIYSPGPTWPCRDLITRPPIRACTGTSCSAGSLPQILRSNVNNIQRRMMTLTAPLLQRKLLIDLVLAEPDGRPKAFKLVKAVIYTACGNGLTTLVM